MGQSTQTNPFAPPTRRRPASGDELKPKHVEAWLRGLPLASVERAVVLFHGWMDGLNQTEIPLADRFRILESSRRTLDTLLQELSQVYLGHPFTLSGRDRRLIEFGQKLRAQLVVGYKIVLQQLANSSVANAIVHRKARVLALYRALDCLGGMLLNDYQLYQKHNPHTWREIHGFYAYTERVRLETKAVEVRVNEQSSLSTVSDQYKRLLLLALADPYALKVGQVELIDRWLRTRAGLCRLLRHAGPRPADGKVFAVDKNSDEPPGYANRLAREAFEGWVLDIVPFAERIRGELGQPQGFGNRQETKQGWVSGELASDPELLRRLLLVWGVELPRSRARTPASGHLSAIVGVEETHRLLAGLGALATPRSLFPAREEQSEFHAIPVLRTPDDELRRWAGAASLVESINLGAADTHKPSWTGSRSEDTKPHIVRFAIQDASSSGYRLSVPGVGGTSPAVGALIALAAEQAAGESTGWRPAVVRWVCVPRSGRTEFGVQNIAGGLKPITVARIRGRGAQVENLPCLLVQSDKVPRPSLITPAFYPHRGDRFSILLTGEPIAIVLTARLESTAAFSQFLFVARGSKAPV